MPPRPVGPIAIVLGTRPEIVKLGPIIRILGPAAAVIHTGQHFDADLSALFFEEFGLAEPATRLGIGGSSRGVQIGQAIDRLDAYFERIRPAVVMVQGDTNSTVAGAIAANARDLPLLHVEAGLRSFDRRMPEEHNRIIADHLADVCCAPTALNRDNLIAEGIPGDRITLTGNPIVEAVAEHLPDPTERSQIATQHGVAAQGFILATFHRPENVDDPDVLVSILQALDLLPLPVLFPAHPRTASRVRDSGISVGRNIRVMGPLKYSAFLALAAEAAVLVSDSGGVQEEASVLKRPVLVVRRSTERPEVIGAFAERVPPGPEIVDVVARWIGDLDGLHARLAALASPYGDGTASVVIAGIARGLAAS